MKTIAKIKDNWRKEYPYGFWRHFKTEMAAKEEESERKRQASKNELDKKRAKLRAELQAKIEKNKNAPKSKWEIRGEKIIETGDKIGDSSNKVFHAANKVKAAANKVQHFNASFTRRVTIPALIFFIGLITLPLGIIIWIVGLLIYASRYPKKR